MKTLAQKTYKIYEDAESAREILEQDTGKDYVIFYNGKAWGLREFSFLAADGKEIRSGDILFTPNKKTVTVLGVWHYSTEPNLQDVYEMQILKETGKKKSYYYYPHKHAVNALTVPHFRHSLWTAEECVAYEQNVESVKEERERKQQKQEILLTMRVLFRSFVLICSTVIAGYSLHSFLTWVKEVMSYF